jgi:hypothetical protein
MKDGSLEIIYPNGDVSLLRFGVWTHIKNNSKSKEGSEKV